MTQVSIIIPAYNVADTIKKTLDSVLAQTFPDFEVLMINDGSTDQTEEVCKRYAAQDSRFVYVPSDKNYGVSHARNQGLKKAKGKWIALLDADDWMAHQRLERMVLAVETLDADIVIDNLKVTNPDTEEVVYVTCFGDCGATVMLSPQEIFEKDTPYVSFAIGYAAPLIRRSFVRDVQAFYNEDYTLSEDFAFLAELMLNGARAYALPFADYYYGFKPISEKVQSDYMQLDYKYDQVITSCQDFLKRYKGKVSPQTLHVIEKRENLFICLSKVRELRQKGFKKGWGVRVLSFVRQPYHLWFLMKMLFIRLIKP